MNRLSVIFISLLSFSVCCGLPYKVFNNKQRHFTKHGCDICADIVFLFDDSSSIPVADPLGFRKMKQFMVAVVQSFRHFGPPSGVQVSVVLVAHTVRNHFYLNNFTDVSHIVHTINTFPELSGSATAIGEGLKFARENSFLKQHGGGRPCANKFLILLTDGKHNLGTMPRPQASALKADGVIIFTIGVGSNVLMSELLAIASKPEFVFNVTDFTQLTTINETIVDSACKVANENKPKPSSPPCPTGPSGFIPYGYILVPMFYPPPMSSSPWLKPQWGNGQFKLMKGSTYEDDSHEQYPHGYGSQLPNIQPPFGYGKFPSPYGKAPYTQYTKGRIYRHYRH